VTPRPVDPPPRPPGEPGRGSIPPSVATRLQRRAKAIAEAVTRPRGKPWDGVTYGRREEPSPKMRADRAKAIREHDAKRKADEPRE
jgi:hypothetical protein